LTGGGLFYSIKIYELTYLGPTLTDPLAILNVDMLFAPPFIYVTLFLSSCILANYGKCTYSPIVDALSFI
jgi:hypothetical protein